MTRRIRLMLRLMRIHFVFIRHGLDEIVLSLHLFRFLRFLGYFNPWNWFRHPEQTRGERIRRSLEDLGPIFVKFGQMISTRRDILPADIANELKLLQDKVPPFKGARKIIEARFQQPLATLFAEFDDTPLASASIAQVHAATLLTGEKVVVKVLRPGVKKMIRQDIELMYVLAELTRRYVPDAKRFKPVEVVAEFERTLELELDLIYEAANASQLRRNFANTNELAVPKVYWDYAKTDVLVFERIYGIPISNIAALKAANVNLPKLAELGVHIFFTQVFRDCFFHADMHPGNLFVDAKDPNNPTLIAVDFGIMGTLTPTDQRYLAENMLAFFNRDYRRVAELHVESNWIPRQTPVNEFEAAIRTVCEPIFERPLKDISVAKLLMRLFQTARQFQMEIQPQLMLLQKTLINVEGLGRELYADLNLWQNGKPFLEKWLRSQMGLRAALRKTRAYLPYWLEKLPEMPEMIYQTLHTIREQQATQQATQQAVQIRAVAELRSPAPERTLLSGILIGAVAVLALVYYPTWWEWLQTSAQRTPQSFWLGSLTGAVIVSLLGMFGRLLRKPR